MKRLAQAVATAMVVTFLIATAAIAQNIAQNRPKPPQSVARLWIEHDLATFNLLKTAPAFYE